MAFFFLKSISFICRNSVRNNRRNVKSSLKTYKITFFRPGVCFEISVALHRPTELPIAIFDNENSIYTIFESYKLSIGFYCLNRTLLTGHRHSGRSADGRARSDDRNTTTGSLFFFFKFSFTIKIWRFSNFFDGGHERTYPPSAL